MKEVEVARLTAEEEKKSERNDETWNCKIKIKIKLDVKYGVIGHWKEYNTLKYNDLNLNGFQLICDFINKNFHVFETQSIFLFYEDEDGDRMPIQNTTNLKEAIIFTVQQNQKVLYIFLVLDVRIQSQSVDVSAVNQPEPSTVVNLSGTDEKANQGSGLSKKYGGNILRVRNGMGIIICVELYDSPKLKHVLGAKADHVTLLDLMKNVFHMKSENIIFNNVNFRHTRQQLLAHLDKGRRKISDLYENPVTRIDFLMIFFSGHGDDKCFFYE